MASACRGLVGPAAGQYGARFESAVEATEDCATGNHLTLAIGYGGRQEVVEAVRSLLESEAEAGNNLGQLAETLEAEDIARHLFSRTASTHQLL